MPSTRPLRVDARRNRQRLLDAAVRLLPQEEDGAEVTLAAIAKEAGVGIGTLYRHFPTREALVDAAYRGELDRLCDSVDGLVRDLPPDQALREWMDRFVDYMATKRGMGGALRALVAAGGDPFVNSRRRLTDAVAMLLAAGVSAGVLRADVTADDLLLGISGVTLATADRGDRAQVGRLLDLLLDGLRAAGSAR
ncbi:DNA-binding transcriptional regulator, AcrR family [Parafrankia irregularis]|uniref:DNA-binding transcriptional regulator, AcrR family n=1 Tax=Parafrankia irregularis TaxID=795642 RepID=A0A0S4QJH7_9ACTN|nr:MULTISPECIES: TetR/AcrR family transcriptional regulator [Parafrankia]MBE3203804.1 TetR/AcrR family transcriptional regulator [Parafrankia sp. CH37]CUU55327.1 DNA-binding transcriptional regulator, AcrR family [Parafrankia irregularis]